MSYISLTSALAILFISMELSLAAAGGKQRKAFINDGAPEHETHLSTEDHGMGRFVADGDMDDSLLYRKSKFEGDMDLRGEPLDVYIDPPPQTDPRVQANAIRSKWRKWPSGVIPYSISSRYTRYSRSRIAAAMDEYAKQTCIRFEPRKSERDYLYIYPDDGCYSSVGRTGGRQEISLDADCIHKGIIMHELMHTTGFFHEQSRTDRDDNINIVWDNLIPGTYGQFKKYSQRTIQHLKEPYDYGSIMHYSAYAFTRNGARTIIPKRSGQKIGQRRGFSRIDKAKINKLYDCKNAGLVTSRPSQPRPRPRPKPTTTSSGCSNRIEGCDFLQSRGLCTKEASYMARNCAKTCGKCGGRGSGKRPTSGTSRGCRDSNSFCGTWAKFGFCSGDSMGNFVQEKCPKSCNLC